MGDTKTLLYNCAGEQLSGEIVRKHFQCATNNPAGSNASAPAIASGNLAAYMHAAHLAVAGWDRGYRCPAARSAILACGDVAVIEGKRGIPTGGVTQYCGVLTLQNRLNAITAHPRCVISVDGISRCADDDQAQQQKNPGHDAVSPKVRCHD